MNHLWKITLDDYLEICNMAKANGKKPGESMQQEFLEYMKQKNIKSIGATELTRKELMKEYKSHNKKTLKIDIDKKGNISIDKLYYLLTKSITICYT